MVVNKTAGGFSLHLDVSEAKKVIAAEARRIIPGPSTSDVRCVADSHHHNQDRDALSRSCAQSTTRSPPSLVRRLQSVLDRLFLQHKFVLLLQHRLRHLDRTSLFPLVQSILLHQHLDTLLFRSLLLFRRLQDTCRAFRQHPQ